MVAMRPVSIAASKLPMNTLVLDQSAALCMYGSTLSALATWFDVERRLRPVAASSTATGESAPSTAQAISAQNSEAARRARVRDL